MTFPTSTGTENTSHAAGQIIASADENKQSSDENALEVKVGTGASVPTRVGDVLTVTGIGATAYQAPSSVIYPSLYPVSVGPWPQDDSGWTLDLIGPRAHPAALGVPNAPALTLMAVANKLGNPSSISTLLENPPTTLQAQHDATASGGICYITPGFIYRETVTISKPITFVGRGRVSLRGSDDWSIGGTPNCTWTNTSGSIWRSSLSMPAFTLDTTTGTPTSTYAQNHRNVLFVDGIGYQLVNSATPTAGQWAMGTTTGGDGGTTKVFLPLNPAGHKIEVGVRIPVMSVSGNTALTLDGLDIRHVPTSGLVGPGVIDLSNVSTAQFSVLNCMIGWCHGFGIVASNMNPGPFIQDTILHDQGVSGVALIITTSALIRRVIFFNCGGLLYGADAGYGSGGIKTTGANGTIYDGCVGFTCAQSALWFDILCVNSAIAKSVVWDNRDYSISHEVSSFGDIGNNVSFQTASYATAWPTFSGVQGIYSSNSRAVQIHNNLVMDCPTDINVYWGTSRTDNPPTGSAANNSGYVQVYDNDLTGLVGGVFAGNSTFAIHFADDGGGAVGTATTSGTGSVMTYTFGSPPANLVLGNSVTVQSCTIAGYNVAGAIVTGISGNTFTVAGSAVGAGTGAVVTSHTSTAIGMGTGTDTLGNPRKGNRFYYPTLINQGTTFTETFQEPDNRWIANGQPGTSFYNTIALWAATTWGVGSTYGTYAQAQAFRRKFGLVP